MTDKRKKKHSLNLWDQGRNILGRKKKENRGKIYTNIPFEILQRNRFFFRLWQHFYRFKIRTRRSKMLPELGRIKLE